MKIGRFNQKFLLSIMNKSEQIQELLLNYVKENTYKDTSKLNMESMLFVEGILDSMGFALLLDFLEETFKFSPADSDLIESNFESINAISGFIKNKLKGTYKETNFFIQVGEYKEGLGWTNFKTLPFCLTKYSYAHPNVSPDGNTLYFIANIRGGKNNTKGPSDIFKVAINKDGTYGDPENLGANVNSYSREMFPYMSKDNVLYFSSNQPNGIGGFDIFKASKNEDNSFAKAEIMPRPINSKESDISFVIDENGNGYLASKRKGGKGDDDIYYFTKN